MSSAVINAETMVNGVASKDNIWAFNTELEYHKQ